MRRRIVIALLAIVVICVLALVLSQPKRGTVEYHLRAYQTALDRYHGKESFVERFVNRVRRWRKFSMTIRTDADVVAQEDALIKLSYLERREFTVTNLSAELAVSTIGRAAITVAPGLCRISAGPGPGVVVVVTPREDMPKWEQLVREAEAAARTNK